MHDLKAKFVNDKWKLHSEEDDKHHLKKVIEVNFTSNEMPQHHVPTCCSERDRGALGGNVRSGP